MASEWRDEVKSAEAEWANIPSGGGEFADGAGSVEPLLSDGSSENVADSSPASSPESKTFRIVSSDEFEESLGLGLRESTVDDDDHDEPCCCLCPKKIPVEKEASRKRYLAFTSAAFQNSSIIHINALITLWITLTKPPKTSKSKTHTAVTIEPKSPLSIEDIKCSTAGDSLVPCPRFGTHWEKIGFQGSDPVTDFRSAGLLPLYFLLTVDKERLHLLYEKHQTLDEEHSYPFALVSINVTVRIMTYLLRKPQKFYKLRKNPETIFIECLSVFLETWIENDYTIRDAGACLKAVESYLQRF